MHRIQQFLLLGALATASAFKSPNMGVAVSTKWVREAEKKHARVALLAVPSLVALGAMTGEDPVGWLNQQPAAAQLTFYASAGVLESYNLRRFDKGFTLKESIVAGKLLPGKEPSPTLDAAEDWAGRAAMLIAAGFFANTLVA